MGLDTEFNPVEWITTTEASQITGYTTRHFQKLFNSNRIDGIRRGHMLFFKREDVIEYMEKMKELGTSKFRLRYKEQN